jgi:cell division transport system permease protein
MSLGYTIREGISGIKRTKLAALTSIFALFISVVLAGILLRAGFNFYTMTQELKSNVEIEVFLNEAKGDQIRDIGDEIAAFEGVDNISYISKDSAMAIFMRDFGSQGSALAELDFLPASYRVSFSPDASIQKMRDFVDTWKGRKVVDEVTFDEELLMVLESRIQTLSLIGLGLAGIIMLATMLLVYNTIRLTIYAKREIIRAMKLVGATDGFIRRPFIIEGIMQGLVASTIAVGAVYLLFHYLIPTYLPQVGVLGWPFGRWYYTVGVMIALGIFLGLIGSRWAAKRFIKSVELS